MKILFRAATSALLVATGLGAQISILGELTHEKNAAPGARYQGSIEILNSGAKPRDVRIYQTDFTYRADGTNAYGDPGTLPRSNAGWITFSPKQTTVQANDKATINYDVAVPSDTSLVGTYWSMIMIEGLPDVPTAKPEQNVGLTIVMRYAIQMITNIGDSGERMLRFFNPTVQDTDTLRVFTLDIENTGQRLVRPKTWIELYSPEGKSFGSFEGSQSRVYPAASSRIRFDLKGLQDGNYKALVVADCGDEALFGANYTLKFGK
jgi:hypothetical protein